MAKSNIVLELRRERLDSGGYTKRGEYFGVGAPLYYWSFWNRKTNEEDSGHVRAHSRAEAKERILYTLKSIGYKINPGEHEHIERGKWIPAHAVKFNKDGSVNVLY